MRQKFSEAVTLVEVLMVVVLFAIVAGLAYQSAWKAAEKTRIKGAWSILRLMTAAQESYKRDSTGGGFAADVDTLVNEGYLDQPNQGQSNWDYTIDSGPQRVVARRLDGRCADKRLGRYYGGATAGNEEETLPSCP